MTATALGRLVGWTQRKRISPGHGRARVQDYFKPDRRAVRLLTTDDVEFQAEGSE
jgi:hypothetical protein